MKSVAVIGLGPAGLVNVKELKAAGFEVQGFDRSSRVGGRWALDDSIATGVWRELCMNETRRFMEFSDFEWPIDNTFDGRDKAYKTLYPHCSEATAYLEAYAKHFDLYPCLNLETEVKQIELHEDGYWKLAIQSRSDKVELTRKFDSLVICTGMHAKPFHPLHDNFRNFTGKVLHSKFFRSVKDYEGQRVLVVGSGISGGDISAALATEGNCKSVVNSVRHVPYHFTKFSQTQKGVPVEIAMSTSSRLPCWLGRFLPSSATAMGIKHTLLANFPEQLTVDKAWQAPDPDIRKACISYTVNYLECFTKGQIDLKPAVASAQGRTVTFVDGTKADFDSVICATGYEPDLSFLSPKVKEKVTYKNIFTGKQEIALYKHTLVPDLENLAFAGIVEGIGSLFPPNEVQARYIAAVFEGKILRPTVEHLEKGVKSFKKFREANPFNDHEMSAECGEQLGDELGITPSYWDALTNPKLYLLAPVYACSYRCNPKVDGPVVARASRERFEYYVANPEKLPQEMMQDAGVHMQG